MAYLYLKAIHIVFVVTWFAGLFYIVRLFVYLAEAAARPPAEREVLEPALKVMARRLWFGIAWPSAVATVILGSALSSYHMPPPTWLLLKFAFIAMLLGYHGACHVLHRKFQEGPPPASSFSMRLFNEVATLLLVGIVFLVVLKDALGMLFGLVGLAGLSAALVAGIAFYRRFRS
jgi:putative membrane protein